MTRQPIIIRNIEELPAQPTSHATGTKKIILNKEDIDSSVTQIARSTLYAGEVVESHVHKTMDEHFLFIDGYCDITISGMTYECFPSTYVFIPAGFAHLIRSKTQVEMITIGIVKD